MPKIGLYLYEISLSRTQSYENIPFAAAGLGSEFFEFLPQFIESKAVTQQNPQTERSWSLEPRPDVGRGRQGLVQYGNYGYSSKIRNPETREIHYDRSQLDVEEIPLYYQFWVPDVGSKGYCSLQSFGDRSCVSEVLGVLTTEFNNSQDKLRVHFRKIMPTDEAIYRDAPVSKLILVTRKVPRDRADLVRNFPPNEVNIEVNYTPNGRRSFGIFRNVAKTIREADGGAAYVLDGIEFKEASALVKIGRNYKKVAILGPSSRAGVIDITDEVELDESLHPKFDSISAVATKNIADFREGMGGER